MAFDPIQSLMALGNDIGTVYVLGLKNVEVSFSIGKPVVNVRFVKGVFLVAVSASNELFVFSLASNKVLTKDILGGAVVTVESDPTLDWVFLGLQSGNIAVYDVGTGHLAHYSVPVLSRAGSRGSNTIRKIQLHPRDVGTLLIAYAKSVVLFSLVEAKVKQEFIYELPVGAPGGNLEEVGTKRYPEVVTAVFHPNGLNLLTVHVDGSLVFWDTNQGKLIVARTIFDTEVDRPQQQYQNGRAQPMQYNQITQVEWICEKNPEYTSLLIAGGDTLKQGANRREQNMNLTRIEFDLTPKYSITSYEKMAAFYSNPKNLKIFPVTQHSSVFKFLSLASGSPFFAGNHDPSVVLVLLEDGSLETLRYPLGKLVYSSSILPPSVAWVHPPVTSLEGALAPRTQWLSVLDALSSDKKRKVSKGFYDDTILKGGNATSSKSRVFEEGRLVLITGHGNGSVRLWDGSRNELDESSVIEIDTSFTLSSPTPVPISNVSFSADSMDLLVSNYAGDTIFYKFGTNRLFDPSISQDDYDRDAALTAKMQRLSMDGSSNKLIVNLENNVPAYMARGFLPLICIKPPSPKVQVTTIKNSSVEFAAIGYSDGSIVIVDRRVQDVILFANVGKLSKPRAAGPPTCATAIEFSIQRSSEDAAYSSILCLVGTSTGSLVTFQILPGASPNSRSRFQAKHLSSADVDTAEVIDIIPVNAATGESAVARPQEFSQLSNGILIKGLIIVVTISGIRLMKSPVHKSASRTFEEKILSAGLCMVHSRNPNADPVSKVLTVILASGAVAVLGIPGLGDISRMRLQAPVNKYSSYSLVLPNGDLVLRLGATDGMLVHISDRDRVNTTNLDRLFNADLKIPLRPSFNSLQWARGSKVTTAADLERVFTNNRRRPASKYKQETEFANDALQPDMYLSLVGANPGPQRTKTTFQDDDEPPAPTYTKRRSQNANAGWGLNMDSLKTQFNDTFTGLEDRIATAGNSVSESINGSVETTKNSMMKSMIKSKFSF